MIKVAISCEGPDPGSSLSRRFGTAPYFLIADVAAGAFDAVKNPGAAAQRGAGVQAVMLLLGRDVTVLLTGYCSPAMRRQLEENGVQVVSGLTGVAQDVFQQYRMGAIDTASEEKTKTARQRMAVSGKSIRDAARRTWNQVLSMLPMTAGVVLAVCRGAYLSDDPDLDCSRVWYGGLFLSRPPPRLVQHRQIIPYGNVVCHRISRSQGKSMGHALVEDIPHIRS